MDLLLFLSALLTGLTGAIAGERRAEVAGIEQCAVAAIETTAQTVVAKVLPVRHAAATPGSPFASLQPLLASRADTAGRPFDLRRILPKRQE